MNFCSECDNMLYPKEDRKNKVLLLACRNCQWETIADNNCIYTNDLKTGINSVSYTPNPDITLDITLPKYNQEACAECGGIEAVYFTPSAEAMARMFVCCNLSCSHSWMERRE